MTNTYYYPDTIQNPLKRFWMTRIKKQRPVPSFPPNALVQTISGCNAECVFCPNHKTNRDIPHGALMEWDLYKRIIDELIDLGTHRISPYLMNEPMLDKELPERIAYITKRKRPNQITKVNTNGSLCTERMSKGILDSGLDRLVFSVQGLDPDNYKKVMNLSLDVTLRNIDRFLELKREGGFEKPGVHISMLRTKMIEPQIGHIRRYWRERNVTVGFGDVENRGHHDHVKSKSIASRKMRLFDWCNRLFEQFCVLCDGRAVMCCVDWEQAVVVGDVSKNGVKEVWQGRTFRGLRESFLEGTLKGMLCQNCFRMKK